MSPIKLNRRAFVGGIAASLSPALLAGCGGGGGAEPAAQARPNASGGASPPQAVQIVQLGSVAVHTTKPGTFPYCATVLPLEGQVPSGRKLGSSVDSTLRGSVLSTWPDGSAKVMVVTGTVSGTAAASYSVPFGLDPATRSEPDMVPGDIARVVRSVSADFGAPGSCSLTDLSAPERIWWANSRVICARYRASASAHQSLELVIDIHAHIDGRALVEIVVENCKVNPAVTGNVQRPTDVGYTNAVIQVNGVTIAAVSSLGPSDGARGYTALEYKVPGGRFPEAGIHRAFRAWYCSAWVGGEDPELEAFQAHTELQQHPMLYAFDKANATDLSVYTGDKYVPWAMGRYRSAEMGAAGGHPQIGPLTQWDARFIQTGSAVLSAATRANTLAMLTYNINYRNVNTGAVPTFAEIGKRDSRGSQPWPISDANICGWEVAHHPASGLVAFLSSPRPVFIEIAQKITVWNGTWSAANNPSNVAPFPWTAGLHGHWYQVRGRAWCFRSQAHAVFLTPQDGAGQQAWKESAATMLAKNVSACALYKNMPQNPLGVMWPDSHNSIKGGLVQPDGFTAPVWQFHFFIPEMIKAAAAKLVAPAAQAELDSVADWMAAQPVRWVNEQPNGGWRYIPYMTRTGTGDNSVPDGSKLDQLSTWGEMQDWAHTDSPPTVAGRWYSLANDSTPTSYTRYGTAPSNHDFYHGYFWAALAMAVDRRVAGSNEAWQTVIRNITDFESFKSGHSLEPRWAVWPRRL